MKRTAKIILAASVTLAFVAPASVASAAPSDAGTTTTETTITVRSGDSLAGIAWRHGVTLSALLRANSIELTTVIHPGDTIVVPAGATVRSTTPSTASTGSANGAATSDAASGGDYVIVAGDALASIAWRNGVTLGALVKANDLTVASVILPGQRLRIPPATRPIPTTVQSSPTATAPAAAPTVSPEPAAQGGSLQTLLNFVTAQVGVPYRFFSAGPDAYDCSGLVVAGFRQIGITVPHQSRSLAKLGTPVDWRNEGISAGDLVFTSAVNDPAAITHVGIALDSSRWVQAVGFGRTVSIGSLPAAERIMAVQRIALR